MNKVNQIDSVTNIYSDCIELIAPVGEKLEELLSNNHSEDYITVGYDILKRIKGNLEILRWLPIEENSIVSIRLITRSIIGDLITSIFLLTRESTEELSNVLYNLDCKYVKSIRCFLKDRNELYNFGRRRKGEKIISNEEFLSEFDEKFKGYEGKYKNYTLKEMAKEIGECNHIELSALEYLYTEYRFLSQTEHYCRKNRIFSYCFDNNSIIQHSKVINHSIKLLIQIINIWIEHKEFKSSLFKDLGNI
ncbi:hypothetical protein [Bacteroides hominis]|jgi:hypothetical protein|uniref:hypothetical protein n=1 Tax=Bacteroides hominis TaxID=2763023 RepID=UPI00294A8C1A|nr:hypothetical protein [Bacteroides hominis (ex Liu et al. 2022)]MDV6191944.1 hypothetical protein [Bacteroides hominis (ex Liu et al. 2022)]